MNTSTPSRTSNFPGSTNPGSASWMRAHFGLRGIGWSGRLHVTWGTITVETLNFLDGEWREETLKLATCCVDEPCVSPATPEIQIFWWEWGSRRDCANCSETNDAEEAESSRARASTEEPSGASTKIRQVMSKRCDLIPIAVVVKLVGGPWATVVFSSWASICSKVWIDTQSSTKWPGCRQFWQMLLDFRVETTLSCDKALNFMQMYSGCLSDLQLPVAVLAAAAWDATGLLGLEFLLKVVGWPPFFALLVGSVVDASEAWTLRSLLIRRTSVDDWLCFCHSNIVLTSSLSSSMEVMKADEGSWPRALSAHRCCWIVSWRRRSSFPDPSLRLGVSSIMRTWVWWIRRCRSYRDLRLSIASA